MLLYVLVISYCTPGLVYVLTGPWCARTSGTRADGGARGVGGLSSCQMPRFGILALGAFIARTGSLRRALPLCWRRRRWHEARRQRVLFLHIRGDTGDRTLLAAGGVRGRLEERRWERVDIGPQTPCWRARQRGNGSARDCARARMDAWMRMCAASSRASLLYTESQSVCSRQVVGDTWRSAHCNHLDRPIWARRGIPQ